MTTLPPGFENLAPYLDWALETEPERSAKRAASRFEDVKRFYDAVFPLLPAALIHLQAFRLEHLDAPSRTLLQLLLSYAEAALVVENFGQVAVPDGYGIERFEVRRLGGTF
ncbi:MAG: Uncharacterized protein K0Q76_792 [Panacagrimonas sp.]|jgi:hypothetical protein|nr:hypothetical protein [Panacagrimonas sp.]MCC2655684.1 Uncharacterized protein [Panacagrimonas sp.]